MVRCVPHTPDVDDGTVRVSESPGKHDHWHLWVPKRDVSDVEGLGNKLQLSAWIQTDTLVPLEDCR